MTDREQTRRDAEQLNDLSDEYLRGTLIPALLAELEQAERTLSSVSATLAMVEDRLKQAERERDEAKEGENGFRTIAMRYEDQLGKVPALVEALRSVARRNVYETVGVAMKIARDALAAYEQEQT